MDRPHVLVVEDMPSVLEVMVRILKDSCDVTTAGGCAEALALLARGRFDVVLTDIRMADGTGFEVLRAARFRAPTTAVVMMTAYANVPDAVVAMKLGAYDYVAKPLDGDEIALVVARAVEGLRVRAEPAPPAPAALAVQSPDAPPEDLQVGFRRAVERARERTSREYLERLLQACHGNVTRAARRAGMRRESLYRVMRRYGIRVEHGDEREEGDARSGGPPGGAG
jgi:DNA-binding NtrC family response regulator